MNYMLEQTRYYWLPLQLGDNNLWVLEWKYSQDADGEWIIKIPPRINAYIRP